MCLACNRNVIASYGKLISWCLGTGSKLSALAHFLAILCLHGMESSPSLHCSLFPLQDPLPPSLGLRGHVAHAVPSCPLQQGQEAMCSQLPQRAARGFHTGHFRPSGRCHHSFSSSLGFQLQSISILLKPSFPPVVITPHWYLLAAPL